MNNAIDPENLPDEATVKFTCNGQAVGKMRNELKVEMVSPMKETFHMATDEGSFHGGDATAPPPLALFIASLTGCIMTQIRAFSKRMKIEINDLKVDTRRRRRPHRRPAALRQGGSLAVFAGAGSGAGGDGAMMRDWFNVHSP